MYGCRAGYAPHRYAVDFPAGEWPDDFAWLEGRRAFIEHHGPAADGQMTCEWWWEFFDDEHHILVRKQTAGTGIQIPRFEIHASIPNALITWKLEHVEQIDCSQIQLLTLETYSEGPLSDIPAFVLELHPWRYSHGQPQ